MQEKKKLMIFNIQKYSLHDGTGIRTVVFLKGCPMHCRWCCNPESQHPYPEVMYRQDLCLGRKKCGLCAACPCISFAEEAEATTNDAEASTDNAEASTENAGAPTDNAEARTDNVGARQRHARKDKACVDFTHLPDCPSWAVCCPTRALSVTGREASIQEILEIVERDAAFYRHGRGGMTVSGGEPLMQENTLDLLACAKAHHLNTSIETCGMVPKERVLAAAAYLDQIFFDVKSMDSAKHKEYTGWGNEQILANITALCQAFPKKPITIRTPVIPGFNDAKEDLAQIENFVQHLASFSAVQWEKLPYHELGVGKYAMLGRPYLIDKTKAAT